MATYRKVTCDYCGKDITERPRHPTVTFGLDNLQTGTGLQSGPRNLFYDWDLCDDCQRHLYQGVLAVVDKFAYDSVKCMHEKEQKEI